MASKDTPKRRGTLTALALGATAAAPVLVAAAGTTHVFAGVYMNHNEAAPRDVVDPTETPKRRRTLTALALGATAAAPLLIATAESGHVFARIALNHNEVAPRDRG